MTPAFDVIPVASWQRIRELEAMVKKLEALLDEIKPDWRLTE